MGKLHGTKSLTKKSPVRCSVALTHFIFSLLKAGAPSLSSKASPLCICIPPFSLPNTGLLGCMISFSETGGTGTRKRRQTAQVWKLINSLWLNVCLQLSDFL
jgi:hypothetical protein